MGKYDSRIWQSFDYFTPTARSVLINGLQQFVQRYIHDDYHPHLVTYVFKQLRGNQKAIIKQMQDEVCRVFATLITRVVRNPRSPSQRDKLPVLLAMADLPVVKREKQKLSAFNINDGLHYHAVILVPSRSRLCVPLEDHFRENVLKYVPVTGCLQRIHVEGTIYDPHRVTNYVFKTFKYGRLSYDDGLLVLPRTLSELPDNPVPCASRSPAQQLYQEIV